MNALNIKVNTFAAFALLAICHMTHAQADGDEGAIEIFKAMDLGQVDVKFIPRDEKLANVLIENKTDQVLHIELPRAIAAVPVLAQFGQVGGGGQAGGLFGGGGGGGGAGNQSVGGGFGAGQNGFGGGGGNGFGAGGAGNGFGAGGGGFMRIAPQKTRKLKATTVCLEYGKPNPNPKVAYRMVPIEAYTNDAQVIELCEKLGQGEVKQKIAQAAAWHLANQLDWQKIAKINRIQSKYLGNLPFFSIRELKAAQEVVSKLSPKKPSKPNAESYARSTN